ncbi:MAG: hypothetical protein V9G12_10455, partial [Microthrixaceae bacterium]
MTAARTVDFPEPVGPTTATTSPGATSRSTGPTRCPPDRIGDHQGLDVEATGRDAPGAVRGLQPAPVDLLEVVDGVRPGGGGVERCTDKRRRGSEHS